MTAWTTPLADAFGDSAVYRRTPDGQQALLRAEDFANSPTLRVLARVNGYTDLKGLKQLVVHDETTLTSAVRTLAAQGLVELVDDLVIG